MDNFEKFDVAVVGAGVIGLAVALRARQAGMSVVVIDRDIPGRGTSWAAAGMIAPVSEADPAEPELLELLLRSAALWPAFAAELKQLSGIDPEFRDCGTLLVARDRDGAEEIEREAEIRARLGFEIERLLPSAARALEPALAPTVRLAASLPGDHGVHPRRVIEGLVGACEDAGVRFERADVADPDELRSGRVVLARGAWSGAPVRPVKGQALLLRDPTGSGLLGRVLRFDGGYIVPRETGRYYLGATVEEKGFDLTPTALGIYELLRDCAEVLPGVLELEIEELVCGLRPGTPDNAPVIGPDPADPRVVWATGHYRHGIVLAPVTADLVVAVLTGVGPEHDFGPARFAKAAA
ncbi:MAG TPA: glycine oxidase ThiO [Baekduia sp.]|nr:glycine oxidase ThiO [Baekduia sp.]